MHKLFYYQFWSICTLLSALTSIANSSPAFCFLSRQPTTYIIQSASELADAIPSIDVYILVDHNNASLPSPSSSSSVRFIQLNETFLIEQGFQKAGMFGSNKTCSAWDKALYYFTRIATNYSFVWFAEEDVFIPTTQAFFSLHELYSPHNDFVAPELTYNMQGDTYSWYHWYLAPGTFTIPWAHGIVCIVGSSRRMLSAVDDYARWRGELTFVEFLFHTIGIQNKEMKIVTPLELNTIAYRQRIAFEQVRNRPNNIWQIGRAHV